MRTPRWLGVIIAILFFGAIYYAAPLGLSRTSPRHFWIAGHPGRFNELGLVVVIAGAALLLWVQLQHIRSAPAGWKYGNPLEGPGYVLESGPYRYCRHPMHLASIAIWMGWALFYGSSAVIGAATLLALAIVVMVPTEERGIEKKLGDEYRQYKARVPRWPWQSHKP